MPINAIAAAEELEAAIALTGTADRAESEKRYLKSDLAFLGTTLGETRSAVKTFVKANTLDHGDLVRVVIALWDVPVFERRMAAVMLLDLHPKLLAAGDLPLLERLIRESLTWALVDALAGDVVSTLLVADPSVESVMDRWAVDPDFWIRRSSLLAELRPLRKGADLGPFMHRADLMLDEKEFFIRKAIGWVLREVGKCRPDEVSAWLASRTGRASGVTMREAVRYLPDADRERLMSAYRERRSAT